MRNEREAAADTRLAATPALPVSMFHNLAPVLAGLLFGVPLEIVVHRWEHRERA